MVRAIAIPCIIMIIHVVLIQEERSQGWGHLRRSRDIIELQLGATEKPADIIPQQHVSSRSGCEGK